MFLLKVILDGVQLVKRRKSLIIPEAEVQLKKSLIDGGFIVIVWWSD